MKKFLTIMLAIALTVSMTACGGSKPAEKTPAAPPATTAPEKPESKPAAKPESKPKAEPKADLANPEYTEAQLATAEKFAAMTDRYQALADKINADENLLALTELVDTMNALVDAINEDDALFVDPANLTPEVLANLEDGIVVGNSYLDELEAMVANYSGKTTITVDVEIVNETGVELYGLAMSPANDTNWGGNMLSEPLPAGGSGVTQMTFTEDTLVWDLMAGDAEETTITFAGIDFSQAPTEGAKLVLSATEGGAYTASFAE